MHLTTEQHEAIKALDRINKRLCDACLYLKPRQPVTQEQYNEILDAVIEAQGSIYIVEVIAGGKWRHKVGPVKRVVNYVQDKVVDFVLWVCDVVIKKQVKSPSNKTQTKYPEN